MDSGHVFWTIIQLWAVGCLGCLAFLIYMSDGDNDDER